MKTMLELTRLKCDGLSVGGSILEKRRDYSRSFTQGLFDLLYLMMADVPYSLRYPVADIANASLNGEGRSYPYPQYTRNHKSTMQVVQFGGSGTQLWAGSSHSTSSGHWNQVIQNHLFARSDNLGIVIGADGGAVSPTQRSLLQPIYHGLGASVGAAADFDNYQVGSNSAMTTNAANTWVGCVVYATRGFRLTGVRFLMYRLGSPGTLTLHIRRGKFNDDSSSVSWKQSTTDLNGLTTTNGDTLPTSPTYELREFTLPTPINIHPGIPYHFMISCALGAASVYGAIRYQSSLTNPRCCVLTSTDAGVSLSITTTSTPYFALRGTCQAEVEYGGSDIFGLLVANPNAQFTLGRIFRNLSGETINVREVGLYGSYTAFYNATSDSVANAYSACIARDTVSPAIALADGENLMVTYTPQITV
jgi:hypothetical protein